MNKAVSIAICLAMVVGCAVGYACNHTEREYYADAMVTAVSDCGSVDVVNVVDDDGMAYSFYADANGYHVGDSVRLEMSNNATPDRYDDAITGAVTL